ncbi:hypothetical protein E2562_009667 [Oryza meyeriana var. granulata]|uniref:RRM domain-containing protein n=1 Tax=Oryza meyeriana var. granulata TaxID=110450 RepID=A0A6G1D092_9ORYZ|nr:hypothetical protein E2562_009667 [Oryza meyeriana var. granulata]
MDERRVKPLKDGRVFVHGLALGTGEADLLRHFDLYGEVDHVYILRNRRTGRPRASPSSSSSTPSSSASPSPIGNRSSTARRYE